MPTVWLAEGLLPHPSAADQDLLFDRIDSLSTESSRLAVEAFGAEFLLTRSIWPAAGSGFRPREAVAATGVAVPDIEALWVPGAARGRRAVAGGPGLGGGFRRVGGSDGPLPPARAGGRRRHAPQSLFVSGEKVSPMVVFLIAADAA